MWFGGRQAGVEGAAGVEYEPQAMGVWAWRCLRDAHVAGADEPVRGSAPRAAGVAGAGGAGSEVPAVVRGGLVGDQFCGMRGDGPTVGGCVELDPVAAGTAGPGMPA
ncbi:hypothetical protein TPA0906_12300 [Streptomyces olivaceus]|nr:hypothetical protein TPA0906_12300 [Streptomyces olivaceus]